MKNVGEKKKMNNKTRIKVGEYVSIKNVLFKIYNIKKKKIILKACSQQEVAKVNEIIQQQKGEIKCQKEHQKKMDQEKEEEDVIKELKKVEKEQINNV